MNDYLNHSKCADIVHPNSSLKDNCTIHQQSINFSSMSYVWRAQKGHSLVLSRSFAVHRTYIYKLLQPETLLVRVLGFLPFFQIILCNWFKWLGKSAKIKASGPVFSRWKLENSQGKSDAEIKSRNLLQSVGNFAENLWLEKGRTLKVAQ